MQLIYKIEFKTTSLYYKHIIEELIKESNINAYCKQFYKGFILIFIDDEQNKIESFFEFLGKELPLSIYLGNSEVIESFNEDIEEIKERDVKINMAFLTTKNINTILSTHNIDFSNDIVKILKGDRKSTRLNSSH